MRSKNLLLRIFLLPLLLLTSELMALETEFKTDQNVFVVGDVHGAYDALLITLQKQNLVDQQGNWTGGKQHLVSLGDLIDRGPKSRMVLDFFRRLQSQAKEAGGQVHVLLGNHEIMNLTADLRYVVADDYAAFINEETDDQHKSKYREFLRAYGTKDSSENRAIFAQTFPKGYFDYVEAFSLRGEYGQWLLEQPFVLKINNQLFAHGGLSEQITESGIDEVNDSLKRMLMRYLNNWEKIASKHSRIFYPDYRARYSTVEQLRADNTNRQFLSAENSLLLSRDSPTWYRGNALCHPFMETDKLAAILARFGSNRLWVGHTTTYNMQPHQRLDGLLMIMDTGMLTEYYGGKPHIARIQTDGQFALFDGLTGSPVEAFLPPPVENVNPFNLTDAKTEVFLRDAAITSQQGDAEDPASGQIIEMVYEDHKFKAIFFSLDQAPLLREADWPSQSANAKRYQHEIAAYHLDRLLNIGLVPVTVEKTIDGKKGALQVYTADAVSKSRVLSEYSGQLGYCSNAEQENLKDVFGYLIQNSRGRLSESYFTADNGFLLFIDNSLSFNPSTQFTSRARGEEIFVSASFKKALMQLTDEKLNQLSPWLHTEQIKAIGLRRDRLLGKQ